MLIKATRLHPDPLQAYMEGMVVAEVVVEGMVKVESAVVVLKVAVVDMSVVVVVESDVVIFSGHGCQGGSGSNCRVSNFINFIFCSLY